MSSHLTRGKYLVSLALNKSLGEKIKSVKKRKWQNINCGNETDPDYVPEGEGSSDSNQGDLMDETDRCETNHEVCNNLHTEEIGSQENEIVMQVHDTADKNEIIATKITTEKEIRGDMEMRQPNDETDKGCCSNAANVNMENITVQQLTKKGNIRKRKLFDTPVQERKSAKLELEKNKHNVKVGCSPTACRKKCSVGVDKERQKEINRCYWSMLARERKWFIFKHTSKTPTHRKTSGPNSRRIHSFKYTLPISEDGEKQEVCKIFFLATLGYDKNNDRVVRNVVSNSNVSPPMDRRGKHEPTNKVNRKVIEDHIESFGPVISHYRREHAPNRRYLPGDITIKEMHEQFLKKHTRITCSYELYRQVVSQKNISFAQLGNEECYECETFKVHKEESKHDNSSEFTDCRICQRWNSHRKKAELARDEYQQDAKQCKQNDKLCFSADLQKVIMLPRCDMFKEIMFTPRIIAFNESFVPLGGKQAGLQPIAVIWHEAVAGRSKEDIISTFYSFFQEKRDYEDITVWLDNCAAQNKNWALLCFFIYIVNAAEVNLKHLQVKYFEPGHTFMSADSFHHQVEKSLKKMKKVYDFNDFKESVQNTNSKVVVIDMDIRRFYDWKDFTSQYKLNQIKPRPYLNDMVNLSFSRGKYTMQYKTSFDQDNYIELNFLVASKMKNGMQKPAQRSMVRGIKCDRKEGLLQKLSPIIPKTRLQFWLDLPMCQDVSNMDD